MTGVVPISPRFTFRDESGNAYDTGSLTVYQSGTLTLLNTYQDKALGTLNTNPITLDAKGECLIYTDGTCEMKFLLKDKLGATVTGYPVDNIPANGIGSFLQAGTGAAPRTAQNKLRDVVDLRDFITGTINEANDYTTELSNAVTQAGGLILQLPPNTIRTQGISAALIPLFKGHGPRLSKLVHIDGSATPLIQVTGGDTGINAYPYDGFHGLQLQAGTSTTALIYFDGRIDNNVLFDQLALNAAAATGDCHGISCRDYLNWNLSRIRWDYITGYAMNVRNANVFADCHLSVDQFSYDNGLPTVDRGKGLLYIDASAFSSEKGVVHLSNGRIEVNTKLTSVKPANSLIRVLQNLARITGGTSQVLVTLDNVAVTVAAAAKDMKFASSDVGTIGLRYRAPQLFGFNEEFANDANNGRTVPMFTNSSFRGEGFNRDHSTDGVIRGESRLLRGMQEFTASNDSNMTSQGGPVKKGDVVYHSNPINSSGISAGGRPFAFKVVNNRSGYMLGAATNLAGTGSITTGTASLAMDTALSSTTVPGMAVDVPGAGAAGATLEAVIRSVDYTTNTITLDTSASTTVTGATVAFGLAQYMAVEMATYSAGIPAAGTFAVGDIVKNTSFNGTTVPVSEYQCTVAGTPGTFRPTKWAVRISGTVNRPTLTASDIGVMFLDTTLDADGKPVWWTGAAWVDAVGAVV